MVAPFASKQVLGAQIGIKEDTSARKFKDVKLSEFFGPKKGGSKQARPNTSEVRIGETAVSINREGMHFSLPRSLMMKPSDTLIGAEVELSRHTEGEMTICSEKQHEPLSPRGGKFFSLLIVLLVTLAVAKTLEKSSVIT
jgi:hypothetical protein